ncbi:MAG: glycerophosphodiester phosphodiesterase [Candidatus Thorarchaeota archaeon]
MKPIIIGHRGAPTLATENTIESFVMAIKLGADMIEMDVHESEDGHLIILHDDDIARVSSQQGVVSKMSLSEIKEVTLLGGERIPTLEEVLELAKGTVKVDIEIKVPGVEKKALDLVYHRRMLKDTLFSSFSNEIVQEISYLEPNAETALIYEQPLEHPIEDALELGASAINPLFLLLEPGVVEYAHTNGLKVYPWGVNFESMIYEMVLMNVDGIITNEIELCKKVLMST